jgi:phenylacetic acid degradation operon negative regulatory protein
VSASVPASGTVPAADPDDAPIADLDRSVCSDGAPSARNLLVTVFGDVLLPCGPGTPATVQALAATLTDFGVNERLVRTSLSRLVADGLLEARSHGRRSSYRVAATAADLFGRADDVIYRGRPREWDGAWTIVILDGAEGTADDRALVRSELGSLGFGVVAPNVLASPLVPVDAASGVLGRVRGVDGVVVTRSPLATGAGMIDQTDLARRCYDLDRLADGYADLVRRLAAFDDATLDSLDDRRATKLRLLVVASFRRLALADPMLPAGLLPSGWPGGPARAHAGRVYRAVAMRSDRRLSEVTGVELDTDPARFGADDTR